MSQENVEAIQAAYEALVRDDRKALDALMQDRLARDFTFESTVTGGTYKGPAGLREMMDDIQRTVDWLVELEEAVDLGEHVLVELRMSGRGSQSGVPVTQHFAVVWTFQEDIIVWGKSFASRAEALEAVGRRD
jgi:ketosteroid isomerase-like protein